MTQRANLFAEWANKKLEESRSKEVVQVDRLEIKIRKRKTIVEVK